LSPQSKTPELDHYKCTNITVGYDVETLFETDQSNVFCVIKI